MRSRDVLPPGTMLDGKYRINHVIGAGGFGITYQARDLGLDLAVAVKEYYPAQFGMRDGTLTVRPASDRDRDLFDRLRESFLREARTLAQLRHPCIVRVLSVFEGHGTAYMIMEFESGKSLKAWLDELGRSPTQDELDRLTMPLLDALALMHEANFLHRDIAPDNIIVRADGSPVLLDFGAARRVMAELSGALTGIVKQGYSPQEQYANDPRAQGPWSDIYALGATLYRCVTGAAPAEATLRMLDDPIQPASNLASGGYRPGFLEAIDKCLAVRPKERPQSINELRNLLQKSSAPASDCSRAATKVAKAPAGSSGWTRISAPAKAEIPAEYASQSRAWRYGIAGLAVLALSGMGWAMVTYGNQREAIQRETQATGEKTRSDLRAAEGERLRREFQVKQAADVDAARRKAEDLRAAEAASKAADEQARTAREQADRALAEQKRKDAAEAAAKQPTPQTACRRRCKRHPRFRPRFRPKAFRPKPSRPLPIRPRAPDLRAGSRRSLGRVPTVTRSRSVSHRRMPRSLWISPA